MEYSLLPFFKQNFDEETCIIMLKWVFCTLQIQPDEKSFQR